jgi:preprotein translocase subunit SecE
VATEALAGPARGRLGRLADFLREVRNEIRKVTWPTWDELRKATLVIVVFVAVLGIVIGLMDTTLQFLLVKTVARLF